VLAQQTQSRPAPIAASLEQRLALAEAECGARLLSARLGLLEESLAAANAAAAKVSIGRAGRMLGLTPRGPEGCGES
jgi:hypothetical protein